ncbi:DUF2087 domain-containing protein [Paenibacillus sp.]|uniref:DUF2087 domain-containing protein n=1 Tax=Paenibacillus sp. TaxID=58172 RepID=UPI003565CE07
MDGMFIDGMERASLEEIERGYIYEEEEGRYTCLICGSSSEQGVIYPSPDEQAWWDAEKWMTKHIVREHGSVFHALLHLDKKWTGLSALQRQLLQFFHQGMSDAEVIERLGGGSASTIRNHRFTLREKEKQAKLFLVLMSLMEKGRAAASAGSPVKDKKKQKPAGVQPLQETVERDNDYFPYGTDGPLRAWPRKEKVRALIAEELVRRFQPGRIYSEADINEVLEQAWHDYAVIRRYMVDHGLLERTEDGRRYWVGAAVSSSERAPAAAQEEERLSMSKERRKELVRAYQEKEQQIGVFRFVNGKNGKALVGASKNLEAMERRLPFELKMGASRNVQLQKDWNEADEGDFTFEVLERLKLRKDSFQDVNHELHVMESKWLNELQPYGERGYNSQPKKRGQAGDAEKDETDERDV